MLVIKQQSISRVDNFSRDYYTADHSHKLQVFEFNTLLTTQASVMNKSRVNMVY